MGYALQLGILLVGADVGSEFDAVAVGIEEVNRLEDAVMRGAEHVDAEALDVFLGGEKLFLAADLEGEVLDPGGRVLVAAHVLLGGQLEEGEHVTVTRVEEHVHVGIVVAGRGHVIF